MAKATPHREMRWTVMACYVVSGASLVYAILAHYFFAYPVALLAFAAGAGPAAQRNTP